MTQMPWQATSSDASRFESWRAHRLSWVLTVLGDLPIHPVIDIEKLTNGSQADDANGLDVPQNILLRQRSAGP